MNCQQTSFSHGALRQCCFTSQRPFSASYHRQNNLRSLVVRANFGDFLREFLDFEKWAPRSSQAWRLGQEPVLRGREDASPSKPSATIMTDADLEVLNSRLARSRESAASIDTDDLNSEDVNSWVGEDMSTPRSIMDSSDAELTDALNKQITRLASLSMQADEEPSTIQNGESLIELIANKYGKRHDVSFVRRDIPGKTLVSMNIYHAHEGQRSFPMSGEEYIEKMDGVVLALRAWGQLETVEAFLREPIAPRRGLPSRPIIGNAVSVKLELTRGQIEEWFGR